MKKGIEERTVHILILASLFFLSGLAFFIIRMQENRPAPVVHQPPALGQASHEPMPQLAHLPLPSTYESFTYLGQDTHPIDGTCDDAYYAVLLYPIDIDYRVSPLDARYNQAVRCTGDRFTTAIPLGTLSLTLGERYYVVKAHQGTSGTWYNPY